MKNRILEILRIQNSQDKIEHVEKVKSVSYHQKCFTEKNWKLVESPKKCLTPKKRTDGAVRRDIHTLVFLAIKKHVSDKVIDQKEAIPLADVHNLYSALFEEEKIRFGAYSNESKFRPQHLLKKLLEVFPTLTKSVYKQRTILHRSDMSLGEIITAFNDNNQLINQIKSTAFAIRQAVLNMETRKLPKNNITLKHILEGECEIPTELYLLVECLLKSPSKPANITKERKIKSICNSIIFSMTNGCIRPYTCLHLGLVTKSLTGSRKMLDILNRLGFCISYTVAEGIETELAYGCSVEKRILPYGVEPNCPHLRTHVAFDNFDKFVETVNGKDTLHDTVGIVYQNIGDETNICSQSIDLVENDENSNQSKARRRVFHSNFDSTVQPYTRGGQSRFSLVGNEPMVPEQLECAHNFNLIWMLNHVFDTSGAKRWFAWNAERVTDQNPMQRIGYLPNLNMSPTSDATVKKTLEMALDIAKECNQNYIIVTYDLAIACKAYKIQADLAPEFDKVFINMGAFHTQMSFYKVSVL